MKTTHVISGRREWAKRGIRYGRVFLMKSGASKWQNVIVSPKDLAMLEELEANARSICALFGVPYELLNNSITYDNKRGEVLLPHEQLYADQKRLL